MLFKWETDAVNVPAPIPVVIFCSNPTLSAVLIDHLERHGAAQVQYAMSLTGRLNGARKSLNAGTVAVFALRSPITEDLELVHRLRREYPRIGIVAIAPMCSKDYARIVKEAGADALVDAGELSSELMEAVASVARQKGMTSQ